MAITVSVVAQDGSAGTYTVTVTRAASNNADLSGLSLLDSTHASPASLAMNQGFSSSTLTYTANVANTVSQVDVVPTIDHHLASMAVNGAATASGTATTLSLTEGGTTTATIVIVSQIGTSKTYTVSVARAASSNADLANLVPSMGTLNPSFTANTASYSMSFTSTGASSIEFTPTTDHALATVEVSGLAVASGSASQTLPVTAGTQSVTVRVTAQSGVTKDYTVLIYKTPSSNADLSSFVTSIGATIHPTRNSDPGGD